MGGDVIDWVAVIVLAGIAWHALTHRDADGERPWVHLLFGCIALLFCLRFLFFDILQVM